MELLPFIWYGVIPAAFGWNVYSIPKIKDLPFWQIALILVGVGAVWGILGLSLGI